MQLERIPWTGPGAPEEGLLRARLAQDGYEVFCWSDRAGADYRAHSHDHDESIGVVEGEITFGAAGREWRLGPGDRLMLPARTVHTARAGTRGATYLIGETR